MLCIVSDVPLRWTPTWNISFVLKNILKKTFLKPMTTLYFIHLKMLRHLKPDLAIAKKLPKHQPYHKGLFLMEKYNAFWLFPEDFGEIATENSRMSIVQNQTLPLKILLIVQTCLIMFRHVHSRSFLPTYFYFFR